MKKSNAAFILLLWFSCLSAFGQPEIKSVFERTADSLYTFYYDSQYYLTEKNCEFFAIKRTAAYNTALKTFEGNFTDRDTSGNILLTGSYKQGKKNGTFKAFYPGGFLKWQAEFQDDKPKDTWYYYYPDGRPKTILKVANGRTYITDAWNEKGKPVVKNGNGKFELIDPQFGYNERGYEAIIYRGEVENGLPKGSWKIIYKYSERDYENAGTEKFENGNFIAGNFFIDGYSTYLNSRIQLAETEPYHTAEHFIFKNCNIDEHFNFTLFLSDYLTKHFRSGLLSLQPDKTIEFTVDVGRNGTASNITLLEGLDDNIANKSILGLLYSIGYWIPSQKEGSLIKDTLTVKVDLMTENNNKIIFTNTKIRRNTGS